MARSPRKSLCESAVQSWVSKSLCSLTTKPFSRGSEGRSWYCRYFLEVVAIRFHDPEPICLSYEALFTLSGNVNSRITDFCVLEVPHAVHAFCLNIRVEVWCAVCAELSASAFKEIMHSCHCVYTILTPFSRGFKEEDKKVWLLHAGQWRRPPSSCHRQGIQ